MLGVQMAPVTEHPQLEVPSSSQAYQFNLLYIWFKYCINNPLLELQLSLWDLKWYMHVIFISHDGHVYSMHVNITVTCMSPQYSCYMHVPYYCNMHVI